MGNEVNFVKLKEILIEPLRNGLFRPKKNRGKGIKMINMGELFSYDRIFSPDMERVPLSESECHYILEPGDLLFARQSLVKSGAGKCSIFLGTDEPVTFEGHIIRARLDKTKASPNYYYYFFNSLFGKATMQTIVEQVAAAGIRQSDLQNLKIPLPSLKEQKRIAHILGTLDDKIELIQRINETLEGIARAVFQSWFVDFDPVRAKIAGESYPLPDEVMALFPAELVDSELGPIPKGWEVGKLGDEFKVVMGQSPPGSSYNEHGIGIAFFQGRTDFGLRYPKARIYCTDPKRFAETGDTLVSVRAPVGDVNMAKEKCCIGRGVAAVRHNSGNSSYTYYSMLDLQRKFIQFEAEGTVFGSMNRKDFSRILVPIPKSEILQLFSKKIKSIDGFIYTNNIQTHSLKENCEIISNQLIPNIS